VRKEADRLKYRKRKTQVPLNDYLPVCDISRAAGLPQEVDPDIADPLLVFYNITTRAMDTAIDLSDASKALDLANIRFQLM
jgi:hypothetical protein